MSLLYCIPFLGMLLSIAVMPLINSKLWEKAQPLFVAFWALCFLVPFALNYSGSAMVEALLGVIFEDYLTFIILLTGLFCVSDNITIDSNLDGSPAVNAILLVIGTLLSSVVGTTGASMIMIRPLLRANSWRKYNTHIFVFFIFLISNMGGCLTPIGDPPLLMGYMRGVPFTWSLRLFPVLLLNLIILIPIFFIIDRRAFSFDLYEGRHPRFVGSSANVKIQGKHNFVFLVFIIIAVILSSLLMKIDFFRGAIHIYGSVKIYRAAIVEIVIIIAASVLSWITTKKEVRETNEFSWGPIKEVAILFIGIFITMIPALEILRESGSELGITQPWQMFWTTGALSSFLDNTPTYLVFLTTAGTLGAETGVYTTVGVISSKMLMAISAGAVFMGANTYIGNAPNFMVKAMAEDSGVRMPTFFGYMFYSLVYLIPVFLLDTLVFFVLLG